MNAIALTILLIVRVLVPVAILFALENGFSAAKKTTGFECEEPWIP